MPKPEPTPTQVAVKIMRAALAKAAFKTGIPVRGIWLLMVEDIQENDRA